MYGTAIFRLYSCKFEHNYYVRQDQRRRKEENFETMVEFLTHHKSNVQQGLSLFMKDGNAHGNQCTLTNEVFRIPSVFKYAYLLSER